MGFITGLQWAHNSTMADAGADYYGSAGKVVTATDLNADIAANKVVMVDAGNASAILIKPLLAAGTTDSGSGTTSSLIELYGVIGFGEQAQPTYDTSDKFFYKLGTVVAGTTAGGGILGTASTQAVFNSPDGIEHKSFTGCGTGSDVANDIFATVPAMNTTPPDMADIAVADVNVGLAVAPGIDIFQQVALTFSLGSAQTETTGNALIALYY